MKRTPAATVWIVDDDLGFVWWLGEILSEIGCRAVPALSCADAVALIRKLELEPDLIVLNPYLSGTAALLQRRPRAKSPPKIITIGAPSSGLPGSTHVGATLERPSVSVPISRPEWLKKIRKLLKEAEIAAAV